MQITRETPTQMTLESKVLFGLLGSTTYLFDKAEKTLAIDGKGLFGGKKQTHSLGEITGVTVNESFRGAEERNDPTARTYRIVLNRKDGTAIPLTKMYTSGKKSKENLADKIRQFLIS